MKGGREMNLLVTKIDAQGVSEYKVPLKLISSGFDYTEWQRAYFDSLTPEQIDADMEEYFSNHE